MDRWSPRKPVPSHRRPRCTWRGPDLGFAKSSLGILLGIIELGLGLSLIAGLATRGMFLTGVSTLVTILYTIFAVVIAISLRRGRTFPCMCFGDESENISLRVLLRTGGLALLSLGTALSIITNPGHPLPAEELWLSVLTATALLSSVTLAKPLRSLLNPMDPFLFSLGTHTEAIAE
ncbi:MAG: MauE/DoxX family redox-associated membrane protein [Acidimicrobiia bacterium]